MISPFIVSDGTCEFCRAGLPSSCVHREFWGHANDGGQAEAIRVPYADGTLMVLPPSVEDDEHLLKAILTLTDVMGTGYHAAFTAGVKAGSIAAVIGDGAVGLCGVLSAKRLGAKRIFIIGHRESRLKLAQKFGATDLVTVHGEQEVLEKTRGGAQAVLECVGTLETIDMAIHMTRPGQTLALVGVPHTSESPDLDYKFSHNITMSDGMAPVRTYMPELLPDVIAGKLDPSPVLDMTVDLNGVPAGYAAMDSREAVKVMVRP